MAHLHRPNYRQSLLPDLLPHLSTKLSTLRHLAASYLYTGDDIARDYGARDYGAFYYRARDDGAAGNDRRALRTGCFSDLDDFFGCVIGIGALFVEQR